ncbi:transcobalamin 2 [Rhinolophus ferrumequinum]|uniref:Transcobalamin-2 n=1 Tax=Rhinolophus ferrumequinum TaxID=59479 RepID=A0A7J7RR71_RHIFE|nr:transcobalamin 2 [Rhinolophus ferrumequinum]
MGHLGTLLFLLGALGALADICNIPEVDSTLVQKLGQHLLPWMDQLSLEHLNPSIYVGLRLSSLEAGTSEDFYLHSLKLNYQQSLLGSASSDDNSDIQAKPSMGQLALYLLALRSNWDHHKGHPHTSYYQYGLSILALCVHQKRVHDSVVGKLLYAVEHDHHPHQGHLSVDTMAMAGLAFTCLKRSHFNPDQRNRMTLAIRKVQEKILKAQTPEGYFGNVYSTPLALQLLVTSHMPGVELGIPCLKATTALLASLQDEAVQNVLMISQLLPVLNQRSYVDLISPDCLAPRVMLEPAVETTSQSQVPEVIHVVLKVPSVWPPYTHSISVPAGSSLEDVLKKAQELGGFMYGTQATLSGPYLTSVMGKEVGEREFWQLIRAPDTPLQQGIADYRPQDRETIELRLVIW